LSMEAGLVLPQSLLRMLEREAKRRGLTPEALTVELLLRVAGEEEKPGLLADAAQASFEHSLRHAEQGEYGEALKRLWSTAVLAVEALSPGRSFENVASYIAAAAARGDPKIYCGLAAALAGVVAAESGEAGREELGQVYAAARGCVENLLDALKPLKKEG